MVSTEEIYSGTKYPMDSSGYDELFTGYNLPASQLGVPTDPRTQHQIKAVADKISTGAKTIEMSAISGEVMESIPEQHLKEINRLKKLTGINLSLHGPIVEPTGFQGRQGWNETDRQQAERQIWSAVQRSRKLDPKGNIVVTMHASGQLMDPETRVIDEKTGKEKITHFWVVDEKEGQFAGISPSKDQITGKELTPEQTIKKHNEEQWFRQLQHVNFNVHQGSGIIEGVVRPKRAGTKEEEAKQTLEIYKKYLKDPEKTEKELNLKEQGEVEHFRHTMNNMIHGDIYLRDSYGEFKKLFDQAYILSEKNHESKSKLDALKKRLAPVVEQLEKDPEKIEELSKRLLEGINVLRSITPPQTVRQLKDFAIDKSSETFSNIAFKSYKEFKNNSPILSIENPPAGMGISRGEELRKLVDETRNKFVQKATQSKEKGGAGLSKQEAEEQAKKLIGVTWDVGHINMIRKFGYDTKQLVKETEKVAPLVKHVHLSDNFGLEHTELPMGMGNVPTKKHLELIGKYNKQAKKIIETGNWFSQENKQTPLIQTFRAFGSSLYAGGAQPALGMFGGYSTGFGQMLPEGYFNTHGAGFSNLPPELGGQSGGRSRLSGAPIE